jgi:hypothetical protein
VSDIFREVDEEIRHERYKELWRRYGLMVIGAAVALVLAVAGYQGWQAYSRGQALSASDAYASALDTLEAGNRGAALESLGQLAGSGPDGYALLAKLQRARLLAEDGDTRAAVGIWTSVANDAATPEPYGTLARLFAVMHQLDTGDPGALSTSLDDIADSDSPFRPTALELQAVLAAKQGDTARAVDLYKQIADGANVPPRQRQRATQMLAQLEG